MEQEVQLRFNTIDENIRHLNSRFDELIEFLKENMVLRKEFDEFKTEMREFKTEMIDFKTEMSEFKIEMTDFKTDMTGFKSEMEQFRLETTGNFRLIHNELEDIKRRLIQLEKRTIEDADASAKDILELRTRIEKLETKMAELQLTS